MIAALIGQKNGDKKTNLSFTLDKYIMERPVPFFFKVIYPTEFTVWNKLEGEKVMIAMVKHTDDPESFIQETNIIVDAWSDSTASEFNSLGFTWSRIIYLNSNNSKELFGHVYKSIYLPAKAKISICNLQLSMQISNKLA